VSKLYSQYKTIYFNRLGKFHNYLGKTLKRSYTREAWDAVLDDATSVAEVPGTR
jgi:hypothetical protein